jgi:transcriptional regulator with XRE-family HTH domain
MFNRKNFSSRLKQLREQENLSTQKLAEAIGLKSKGSITQFEKSLTTPSADTLIALADFFDVSLDYIVGRSDDPGRH